MSTSRRGVRAVCALLAAAGVTGAAVLTSGTAFGGEPASGPAPADLQWTGDPGLVADVEGHLPQHAAETGAGTTGTADAAGARTGTGTADAADWSLLGPLGGDIRDVAFSPVDPDVALAGLAPTQGGRGALYRSTDGGATWTEVPGLDGAEVYAVEYAADGTAYIGTLDGAWRSDDGGVTWVKRNLGIGAQDQVMSIAVDPTDSSVVWAGIGNALGMQQVNLIRSTDGGVTWTDRTPPFVGALSGRGVAIDPHDPDTVVAGFLAGQVWVTTDGGATWTDRSAGLPQVPITQVSYDGSRLLASGGQLFGSQDLGLYQSTDLGQSWTPLSDDSWPVLVVQGFAVDPSDPDTILVGTAGNGVHRTTDGGATWDLSVGGTDGLAGRSLTFVPGSSGEVFFSTEARAVFRSTDGGDSFVQSSDGISEIDLRAIHVNPLDPDEIAIAYRSLNGGGVFTTVDGGASWTLEPVPPTRWTAVTFAPDGTLYAISDGPSSIAPEGLYRRDGDGSWASIGPDQGPFFESRLGRISFSRTNPDLILLGGADFGFAGREATIWRTADRGQTWVKSYEGADILEMVMDIEIVADGTDQEVVASVHNRSNHLGRVMRSETAGRSWFGSTIGLPGGRLSQPQLCASSADPHRIYLAAGLDGAVAGVFGSGDGGLTWQPAGGTTPAFTIADLACDPADGRTLYLLLVNGDPALVRSQDAGESFSPFVSGLGENRPRAVAFADRSRLVLASSRGSFAASPARDEITLAAAGRRERGQLLADLSWAGATSTEVDVYRNGVRVATVPHQGAHTDPIDATGRVTTTYQVCRADSTVCSNQVTVRFGGPPAG